MVGIEIRVAVFAVSTSLGIASTARSTYPRVQEPNDRGATQSSTRLLDGNEWTTTNLNVNAEPSFCYGDAEPNCGQYGRLYTWESAQRACQSLRDGWRLPTNDEWRQMANHYGGVGDDSADNGKTAYTALMNGGSSGFNATLGGGRGLDDGEYGRVEAHGFYWTATENGPATAWFYNFARGRLALYAQREGEKQRAFSVRCVRK